MTVYFAKYIICKNMVVLGACPLVPLWRLVDRYFYIAHAKLTLETIKNWWDGVPVPSSHQHNSLFMNDIVNKLSVSEPQDDQLVFPHTAHCLLLYTKYE